MTEQVNDSGRDLRVLVVAPTGRDAALICELLRRSGIDGVPFPSVGEGCAEVPVAGAMLLAEEALSVAEVSNLHAALEGQPPWSDFPLILLTASGEVTVQSQIRRALREPLGNILLLERPVRPETLISTVRSALRARQRQYEIRDQLVQYRKAEEALRKTEKLAIAGRLAASIAHEINNPLEAVTNVIYLMKMTNTDSSIRQYLEMAEHELARVTEITKQTLKFYREPAPTGHTDVAEVCESVLQLYAGKIAARNVRVHKELAHISSITAGPGELRQLLANLVGNALDAMRGGGDLRIRTRHGRHHTNGHSSGVRVTIADSGTGIPFDLRTKVFEPFVSTKGDTGTGLGLWVTSEIVKKYGGEIRLRSCVRPGRSGTTFSVFLPYGAVPAAELESAS